MIKYDPMELFAMLTDQTRKELLNPARNDIPVPEGFDEALEEARKQRAQWLEQQKALERLEREARRAEHEGLSVCGDNEWGKR
tara:strand:+ start:965 stop:1213 length:249 start_codon:yes stop_codon:yes gene_type:complete